MKMCEELEKLIADTGGEFINLNDCVPDDPNPEHGLTHDALGFVPQFLHTDDDRPAAEQIDDNYAHGGGWRPNPDRAMFWRISKHDAALVYDDGDGPAEVQPLVATAQLRDEEIHIYDGAWMAIIQPDGSFQVSRVD
jgi:hypothetical protein